MSIPSTASDFDGDYGGEKDDYLLVETDPLTDRAKDEMNRLVADTSMMTRTCPRAIVEFVTAASTGALSLTSHDAMWGNAFAVEPVMVRDSQGLFTLTWPTTVDDPLEVEHTLAFRYAVPAITNDGTRIAQATVTANTVTVKVMAADGTGNVEDAVGASIVVVVY